MYLYLAIVAVAVSLISVVTFECACPQPRPIYNIVPLLITLGNYDTVSEEGLCYISGEVVGTHTQK